MSRAVLGVQILGFLRPKFDPPFGPIPACNMAKQGRAPPGSASSGAWEPPFVRYLETGHVHCNYNSLSTMVIFGYKVSELHL